MKTKPDYGIAGVIVVALLIGPLFASGGAARGQAGAPAQPGAAKLDGHWRGTMVREGAAMDVRFDFKSSSSGGESGSFTSLTQRAIEYPLDTVAYTASKDTAQKDAASKVHWVLGGSIVFDGTVSADSISGTFTEGDGHGTFTLRRATPEPLPYRREDVTFRNGAITLAGTLLRPRGVALHPGIVFLHGSGPETRWGTSLFFADQFARSGVAALVLDKRGTGQSTGDWTKANFDDLAGDYLAAVHFLQQQSGVNSKQVGIYGHSQGGTLSPLIASRSETALQKNTPGAVAFVIAAAAIGTGQLYTQDIYRTRNELVDAGFQEPELGRAMALYSKWLDYARNGGAQNAGNWHTIDKAMAAVQNEKWFQALELPRDKNNWIYKWYPPVGNFNPLPLWERVKVPVLLIYGERDRNTPVDPSLAGIGEALRKAGNSDFTPVIIPGAAHNLTIQWPRQEKPGEPFFWWYGAPGYPGLLTSWVKARFSGN